MTIEPRLRSFSPIFPVRDLPSALLHYASLGFATTAYDDGYGFADRDGVGLHLSAEGDHAHEHAAGEAYLYVDDADALCAEWTRPGIAGTTHPVHDTPYRLREGAHVDPDGNVIRFGSPRPGADLPDRVAQHLESTYAIKVTRVLPLDLGVFRVDRSGATSWVARVFPETRPLEAVVGDAEILSYVAEHDFPAERCAVANPVSTLAGRGVLVTEFVEGVGRQGRREAIKEAGGIRRLGDLLGRLHALADPPASLWRAGGAWHHLADGPPAAELAAAQRLLEGAEGLVPPAGRDAFDALGAALADIDACDGLPTALLHPDFVMANVVASPERGLVLVDWSGAGVGPRLWSLAFLLLAEGAKNLGRIDLVLDGYRRHVDLEPAEVERVGGAALARPVIFAVWRFCVGRATITDAAGQVAEARTLADAVSDRVRGLCR